MTGPAEPPRPRPGRVRRARGEQDEARQLRGWFVGACGHPVLLLANGHVDACECDGLPAGFIALGEPVRPVAEGGRAALSDG